MSTCLAKETDDFSVSFFFFNISFNGPHLSCYFESCTVKVHPYFIMRSCKPHRMCAEFDIQFRELMRLDKSVPWFLEAKTTVRSRLLRNYTYTRKDMALSAISMNSALADKEFVLSLHHKLHVSACINKPNDVHKHNQSIIHSINQSFLHKQQ